MSEIDRHTLLNHLHWRYATKKFDPKRKISEADWKTLEHALVLSPSSYGLQPWKFVIVTDPKVRQELLPASWGQHQVVDASHLVVFAARNAIGKDDVLKYISRISEVRDAPPEALSSFRDMMLGSVTPARPEAETNLWTSRQAYIALGILLSAAALLKIDTCPMEGFEPAKYDQILGLDKMGYSAVVLCTAGYRAADDAHAHHAKVRFDPKDVLVRI